MRPGAVGSIVGQIAKIKGCAIGIAGSDDKVRYVVGELGFDGAGSTSATPNYVEKLRELCPKGMRISTTSAGRSPTP